MAYLEYNPTDTLYHYTGVEGFKGIVTSKKIWMSELRSTNDPREISFGLDQILQSIQKLKTFPNLQGVNQIILLNLEKKITDYIGNGGRFFFSSFTPIRDQLPIWREYCQNGKGISIGFRPTAIKSIPCRIQKVQYTKEICCEQLCATIIELIEPILFKEKKLELIDWLPIITELTTISTKNKHISWQYENEVRCIFAASKEAEHLYALGAPQAEYDDGTQFSTRVLTRGENSNKIEYISLPFGKYKNGQHDHSGSICEVILGYNCELNEDDVSNLLVKNGYVNFAITRSECQVR